MILIDFQKYPERLGPNGTFRVLVSGGNCHYTLTGTAYTGMEENHYSICLSR